MKRIVDIRKPTSIGNSIYLLVSGILDKDKFYSIIIDSDNNQILIREAQIGVET